MATRKQAHTEIGPLQPHTHIHTHTHPLTHPQSPHTHTRMFSLSLSLSHTHPRKQTNTIAYTHRGIRTYTNTRPTKTHTHTHPQAHTHTLAPGGKQGRDGGVRGRPIHAPLQAGPRVQRQTSAGGQQCIWWTTSRKTGHGASACGAEPAHVRNTLQVQGQTRHPTVGGGRGQEASQNHRPRPGLCSAVEDAALQGTPILTNSSSCNPHIMPTVRESSMGTHASRIPYA